MVQDATRHTPAPTPPALLEVRGLSLRFGGVTALNGLSFEVPTGVICGLIGPNGAGKTSLFNCVSRLYQPTEGSLLLDGEEITGLPARRIAARGIARTFQNLALVPDLSVLENVMLGGHHHSRTGFVRAALLPPALRPEERRMRQLALELLDRLDLGHLRDRRVSGLPYPTLKRVELARALASRPRLLLLDEPAGGLTHQEVDELAELLLRLRSEFDLTVLLVEHHMGMVMKICERIVVMDFGQKISEGTPAQVQSDPRVIEAYLGASAS